MEPNVELSFPKHEDAPALTAAVRESLADLIPWMEWANDAYDVKTARHWIDGQQARRERSEAFEYLIKGPGEELLGCCGINRISAAPYRFANIGYWIRSSAMGNGVATAAVLRLVEIVFRETHLVRLEIVVAVGNKRSRRVAEKVGATFEGTLRSRLWTRGPQDALMYSLIRPASDRRA
jgi:RimJ/RimL family protein N-acetyltransferase